MRRDIEKCQSGNGIPYCWFWTSWRPCAASCSSALCRLSVRALPPSPLITHSSTTCPLTYRPVFSSSSLLSLSLSLPLHTLTSRRSAARSHSLSRTHTHTPASGEGLILLDAVMGREREGEREEKRRKRGRCGGSLEEGRGAFGVEPVRKSSRLFIHTHSFALMVCVP